jgi:hypothetical protein
LRCRPPAQSEDEYANDAQQDHHAEQNREHDERDAARSQRAIDVFLDDAARQLCCHGLSGLIKILWHFNGNPARLSLEIQMKGESTIRGI